MDGGIANYSCFERMGEHNSAPIMHVKTFHNSLLTIFFSHFFWFDWNFELDEGIILSYCVFNFVLENYHISSFSIYIHIRILINARSDANHVEHGLPSVLMFAAARFGFASILEGLMCIQSIVTGISVCVVEVLSLICYALHNYVEKYT